MISWENPWHVSSSFFWRLRTLPSFLVWSVVGFASGWVQTRRLGSLFLGAPALILAFVVIAMTLQTREDLSSETVRRYITRSQMYLKENRVDQAEFYINRLKTLGYQSDPILVTRAEIATRRQRLDLADVCYREMLTNSDHTQDALAHRQLALSALRATPDPQSATTSEAILHLQKAIEANPGDLFCHELLAKLFLTRNDLGSVIRHFEPVAQQNPAAQIQLARLFEKVGRNSKKVEAASKAERYFSRLVTELESKPLEQGTSEAARTAEWSDGTLNWSESLIMQGKLDEAISLVTAALDRQDLPALRHRVASIYVRKSNTLPVSEKSWQPRWELITLCRNYDPDSRESLVVLAEIASHAPFELRQMAQRELAPYLENGQAPPAAYYLVGTAAAEDKQWSTAIKLLRKSVQIEPRAGIAWNNLAFALYSQTPPDWQDAERCVSEAIRLEPHPAQYHETRGQIMVGLEHWTEVVRELELALQGLPPQARIHGGLALAYQNLGDEDLADYHRTREAALTQR